MDCPECKHNIGFFESLTIINPLHFKCKKCSNYISLSRSSIKTYILMLVVIFIISFLGFLQLEPEKILSQSFLILFIPAIFITVTVIHYFFWSRSTAESKSPDKGDYSGLSC